MVLHEPTRDGDTEIHIVSNLPKRIGAIRIAELYRDRWQIETAFQEVAESLEGEIKTLGYPKAALFGFCMALVTYNLLSVVRAAVQAVHGEEAARCLSTYYMANEVASTHVGMSVVLDAAFWKEQICEAHTDANGERTQTTGPKHTARQIQESDVDSEEEAEKENEQEDNATMCRRPACSRITRKSG